MTPPAYHLDHCADLAVAVVELARREAAAGDAQASVWLAQVRQDILDNAPPHLAERWAGAVEPSALLQEAYQARKAAGTSYAKAFAELGGAHSSAMEWWRGDDAPAAGPDRRAALPHWAPRYLALIAQGTAPRDAAAQVGTRPCAVAAVVRTRLSFAQALEAAQASARERAA